MPAGNHIFPSVILGKTRERTASAQLVEEAAGEVSGPARYRLGDPGGLFQIDVTVPEKSCRVVVTVAESAIFRESTYDVTIPAGQGHRVYQLYPYIRYKTGELVALRQPVAQELAVFTLTVDGVSEQRTEPLVVRSINDCLLGTITNERYENSRENIAAYVNENNLNIDRHILRHARQKGFIPSFDGATGDRASTLRQMEAVYRAVKDLNFAFTSTTTASDTNLVTNAENGEPVRYDCQRIRFLNDSLEGQQVNCVDGTILFASVFRKLGFDTVILLTPTHAMVGVYLPIPEKWVVKDKAWEAAPAAPAAPEDRLQVDQRAEAEAEQRARRLERQELVVLETTAVATDSFSEACKWGTTKFLREFIHFPGHRPAEAGSPNPALALAPPPLEGVRPLPKAGGALPASAYLNKRYVVALAKKYDPPRPPRSRWEMRMKWLEQDDDAGRYHPEESLADGYAVISIAAARQKGIPAIAEQDRVLQTGP
ncbi:MAG: hypothetical protein NTV51_13445 [Verrucomicrobia bacterium]|nr:hypothetical protein [Verrucomicrobiota bacterium]